MNVTKVVVLVLRIPEHFSLHFSDFYTIFYSFLKFAVLSLGTFCSLTPGSFGSFNLGSLAEIQNRGGTGSAFPGDGDGWRRGESGGTGRGVHAAPNGGLGSSGGGRRRRVRGEGRPAVALLAGVHAPAGSSGVRPGVQHQ